MYQTYYFERFTQNLYYPIHFVSTSSPRKFLFGVNFLLILCAIALAGFSLYLCYLLYDAHSSSVWINWFGMCFVCLFMVSISIVGMRGAHLVSLDLLLAYFWGIIVCLVPLLLALFACFNISLYTKIWFKHNWELQSFDQVRQIFCHPRDTYDNKCIAPLIDYTNIDNNNNFTTSWCIKNYNATDCVQIRDDAISRAVVWGTTIIISQSCVGLGCVILSIMSIYVTVEILTSPVITQSMFDVMNYLLILPFAACLALSIYLWWTLELEIPSNILPYLFLALALAQVIALPIGILAGKYKSKRILIGYIIFMILISFALASVGGLGWTLAKIVVNDYDPDENQVAKIACHRGLPGCKGCDLNPPQCKEWNTFDVLTLISLDYRLAGMVAILSILFILGGLIVSILVFNGLRNYKTDFI